MLKASLLNGIILVCAAMAVGAATPTPTHTGPGGFGKAKFGMTVEQVRKYYPKITPAAPGMGAAYFNSPDLTRYVIGRVKVPGFAERMTVELRFWKKHLWSVIFYYGSTSFMAIAEDLHRRYGDSTTQGIDPTWALPNSTITTAPSEMWYSYSDSTATKDVQRAFAEAIQAAQQRAAARAASQAAPTPPVTPVP